MKVIILKATLLFVIVNSNPTPGAHIPPVFEYDNFKSVFLKIGQTSNTNQYYNKQTQVALSAWKQGVILPKNNYSVLIIGTDTTETVTNIQLEIDNINYNGTDHKDWVRVQNFKWVDIPEDYVSKFEVTIRPNSDDIPESLFIAHNWTFHLYFKIKNSSLEGVRENENDLKNPTVEYCSKSIVMVGPNKTLGAKCQITAELNGNNITFKYMDSCLNWRRVDDVGLKCTHLMNKTTEEKSIDVFCAKDPWLEDCKCINRRYYQYYQEKRPHMTIPDYCWYIPCKDGGYLIKRKGERVQCINTSCEIIYDDDGNKYLNCTQISDGRPEWPSEPMDNPDY